MQDTDMQDTDIQDIASTLSQKLNMEVKAGLLHQINPCDLQTCIDSTLLKPTAGISDIEKLCQESLLLKVKAVCVYLNHIELAAKLLRFSPVDPITTIGFPMGNIPTKLKLHELEFALSKGAKEIDMVMQIGDLMDQRFDKVFQDIHSVVLNAGHAKVKVIIESALLTKTQIVQACLIAKTAKAHYVKTSTGFLGQGASVQDIALMKKTLGDSMGIKASGGIDSKAKAMSMLQAGATRIGTSKAKDILC